MPQPQSPQPTNDDQKVQKIGQEFEEALKKKNYVRAELLARQLGRPEPELKELQRKALQQFIVEFRNPEGVLTLAQEYKISKEELGQLFSDLLSLLASSKQFDIKSMSFLNLEEWLKKHFSAYF